MRAYSFIALLLLALGSSSNAKAQSDSLDVAQTDDPQTLFLAATRHYDNSDYERARDDYRKIIDSGWQNGILFYNMGNTYFRLNNLGESILFYERAFRLMPNHEALRHNLRVARAKTANRFRLLPKPFWSRAWNRLIYVIKPTGFLYSGLAFYLLGMAFLTYRTWIGYRREWVRRIWTWSLLFGVILLALAIFGSWTLSNQRSAVIVDTSTPLFSDPKDLNSIDIELHEGLTVDLLKDQDGLFRVRLPDGHKGWISSNSVLEI